MHTTLKTLSNEALNEKLKKLISKEREILSEIILHIIEVDRRKLYLSLAYPNLFEYLIKHIGYSAGSAQRRIDAARLSREVPEVITNLENGKINLSQISLMQKAIRQVQTEQNNKVALETKEKLIEKIQNKSFSESEVMVNKTLNIEVKESSKTSYQQNESVRLEVTLTQNQWEKMLRMRELLSNTLPNGSWDQVFEYVAEKVIQQKDKASGQTEVRTSVSKADERVNMKEENMKEENMNSRSAIPKFIQRQVFTRDKCCQYQDKNTKQKCGSKWQLNLDHIQPVWDNGSNRASNLRVLCANHNREVYRLQSNIKTIC